MDKKVSLADIFITFLKSGLILLGGGYIILPILQSEIVDKRGWLTSEELTDYYAVSQSLPGLIAINISILVGHRLRGKRGAFVGVLGITFFAFWAIVLLSSILTKFASNSYVQGAFLGIGVAVVVLIISAVREMWDKAVKGIDSIILFILAFSVMYFKEVSPAVVILSAIPVGILWNLLKCKRGAQ
ncbi:MAG: chromate transporter [Cyanobacteria bacterium RUI128]|nr:chromate transporter [Cyanobacteria bacterium RUI128]